MTAPRQEGTDLFAVVLAALFGLDRLLWLAAWTAAGLEGRHLPKGHLLAPLAALAEPARPERAWGGRVAGPVLYWTTAALVFMLAAVLAWGAVRLWRHDAAGKKGDPTRA